MATSISLVLTKEVSLFGNMPSDKVMILDHLYGKEFILFDMPD
jgi:hypothetical protein